MNETPLIRRMQQLCHRLDPQPTGVSERLPPLPGIRAVLFDVYGTLFISGSGDIGPAGALSDAAALEEALSCAGFSHESNAAGARGAELFEQTIRRIHAGRRAGGTKYPEVEIRDVWRTVLGALMEEGLVRATAPAPESVTRLAIEYEFRVNPVWPMPGIEEMLKALREKGVLLGIVSNAQFYTPLLFPALLGGTPAEAGFEPAACVWSFEALEAKPSTGLFQRALDALQLARDINPPETLYVGNDQLNDIWPASQVGFRTALFAGDRRSLRRRKDDGRCAEVRPDAVVTELLQIPPMIA